MLRTEELLAAHRFDGAEQYFTRAIDFGYSFSIEETLEKWGKQEILGDYVRMIRTIRPDVIVGFVFDGDGGGQHHQASSRLDARSVSRRGGSERVSRSDSEGRPAPVAGEEVLLHRRLWRPSGGRGQAASRRVARPAKARRASLPFTGGDDVRPGARPDLRRDRRRSAQHAQVPGHVAAPAAAAEGNRVRRPRGYRLRDTVLADGVNRAGAATCSTASTRGIDEPGRVTRATQPPAVLTSSLERDRDRRRRRAQGDGDAAAARATVAGARCAGSRRCASCARALAVDGVSARRRATRSISARSSRSAQFAEALVLAADMRLEAIAARRSRRRRARACRSTLLAGQSQRARPGDDVATLVRLREPEDGSAKTTALMRGPEAARRARSRARDSGRCPADGGAFPIRARAARATSSIPMCRSGCRSGRRRSRRPSRSTSRGVDVTHDDAGAVPLRGRHLQRREARASSTSCRSSRSSVSPEIAIVPLGRAAARGATATCASP